MTAKHLIFVTSLVFWTTMSIFLVQKEIIPFFEYEAPPSYRDVLPQGALAELTAFDLLIQGKPAGSITILVRPHTHNSYLIEGKINLELDKVNSKLSKIRIISKAKLDSAFQLDRFDMSINNGQITAAGVRNRDQLFLTLNAPWLGTIEHTIEFPKDMVLSDIFLPFQGASNLYVGKKWLIQTVDLDPFGMALKTKPLWAVVDMKSKTYWNGKPYDVYQVELRNNPSDPNAAYTVRIDDEGRVLEQDFKIFKYPCRAVLREKRKLSPKELSAILYDGSGGKDWFRVEEKEPQ